MTRMLEPSSAPSGVCQLPLELIDRRGPPPPAETCSLMLSAASCASMVARSVLATFLLSSLDIGFIPGIYGDWCIRTTAHQGWAVLCGFRAARRRAWPRRVVPEAGG